MDNQDVIGSAATVLPGETELLLELKGWQIDYLSRPSVIFRILVAKVPRCPGDESTPL